MGGNAVIIQLFVERLQHFKRDLVDIDRQPALVGSPEQGADAVEYRWYDGSHL